MNYYLIYDQIIDLAVADLRRQNSSIPDDIEAKTKADLREKYPEGFKLAKGVLDFIEIAICKHGYIH